MFSPLQDEAESDAEEPETDDGTALPDNPVDSDDDADEYYQLHVTIRLVDHAFVYHIIFIILQLVLFSLMSHALYNYN